MPFVPTQSTGHRRFTAGVCTVVITLALVSAMVATAEGQTYYVDNGCSSCSNLGPGTEAQPYCSIGAAVTAHRGPGVTILVKPGVYREQVSVAASGAPGEPFTIRALGPGVRIEGADDFSNPESWVQDDDFVRVGGEPVPYMGSAWLASGVRRNPRQVLVDGVRLTPSTAAPELLPANTFTWVDGQGLYVNLGGDNPGTREIQVSQRDHGFNVFGKSWVTIDGFEILRTDYRGINLQVGCSDVVIARNRVAVANGAGIQAVGGTRLMIEGNVVSGCGYHGIALINGTNRSVVRDNECFENADPVVRRANGIYLYGAVNNTLSGNRVHHNQDTGIQLNGGSRDCLAFNNISWSNGDHGFDHLDASGTVHVHSVAYKNAKDGFSFEGNSPDCKLYNSIAIENGLATDEYNLWVNSTSAVGFVSDHNIFWNSTAQPPIKFGTTTYASLAHYQGVSGEDGHSMQTDPMFANPGAGNFMLQPDSPAIDAANSAVPFWPATDAAGSPRLDDVTTLNQGEGPVAYADIGALESTTRAEVGPVQLPGPQGTRGERTASMAATDGALETDTAKPAVIWLSSGYPNPSRGAVDFALELPHDSQVAWAVFDLQGRVVWSEERAARGGRETLRWEGRTSRGEPAATGVYLVRARVDGVQLSQRVVRF